MAEIKGFKKPVSDGVMEAWLQLLWFPCASFIIDDDDGWQCTFIADKQYCEMHYHTARSQALNHAGANSIWWCIAMVYGNDNVHCNWSMIYFRVKRSGDGNVHQQGLLNATGEMVHVKCSVRKSNTWVWIFQYTHTIFCLDLSCVLTRRTPSWCRVGSPLSY